MLLHCSVIREAFSAVLTDRALPANAAWENDIMLIEQTAALASIQANRMVTKDHVRNVLNTMN